MFELKTALLSLLKHDAEVQAAIRAVMTAKSETDLDAEILRVVTDQSQTRAVLLALARRAR